jgi:ubiquinone/menaquinone biosynthesis C-methylase UbiE
MQVNRIFSFSTSLPGVKEEPMEVRTVELQPVVKLQSIVDMLLSGSGNIKVLEAGCGAYSYVAVPKDTSYIVGIDVSEEQLRKNCVVDEKILGDIQTYRFPCAEFDLIVCWWVLEHLAHPEKALNSFLKFLKEDGVLVLAVPNVFSIKGLVTKYAPFWFHTWSYRVLYGIKGYAPFHTFLRFSIAPISLRRFAARNGLSIEYSCFYTNPGLQKSLEKYKFINAGWQLIRQTIKALSFGRIDVGLEEYLLVLKK